MTGTKTQAAYTVAGRRVDSLELKALVVSRGVKVDREVYRRFSKSRRLSVSPLCCNCFRLSDDTIVQLTDMGFHLRYLTGMLSWDNLKLLKYAGELGTPFSVRMRGEGAALYWEDEFLDTVRFFPYTDFYAQKTAGGLPFAGNAVIQGCDWVAFQCLWPCEYAAAGKSCEFCFSGADFEHRAAKGKPQPAAVRPEDMAEIVEYAIKHTGCSSIQITGGSTFCGKTEAAHIRAYLRALDARVGISNIPGEILLYITPPEDFARIDEYFALGASRVACSLEVWDEDIASRVTPGKMAFTTRRRHLEMLVKTAEKYGPGKAFSNFIIGLEPIESLAEGAEWLASRGVIPSASVWMPMGRPVQGSMTPPDAAYFRQVKELLGGLYLKYGLEPAGCCGLNVCVERDIWRWAGSGAAAG